MSRPLEGKVVLVTGGGRGIGRAHALACARAGAAVLVNDRGCDLAGSGHDPDVARAVAAEIIERGGRAIADDADVAEAGAIGELVARAVRDLGGVSAVIAAAGLTLERSVLSTDDAHLEPLLALHLTGSLALVRASARAMIDAGDGGSIVLHAGTVGLFGALRQAAPAMASAAILGLVRSAAIELRKHGIRVNALVPTARTRATEHLPLFQGIAVDSLSPDHVGPLGVFLASDMAREITGEVIGVAGARVYALHGRETPGWFGDGAPVEPAELAARWAEITRP